MVYACVCVCGVRVRVRVRVRECVRVCVCVCVDHYCTPAIGSALYSLCFYSTDSRCMEQIINITVNRHTGN